MQYNIPDFALLLLVGPSGSGKSTFAKKHFTPSEVLSPYGFAQLIADGDSSQEIQDDAWQLLDLALEKRMVHRKLTVVDALNLSPQGRSKLRKIAKRHYCPFYAVVFDLPEKTVAAHNARRNDPPHPPAIVKMHLGQMQGISSTLKGEGMKNILHLQSPKQIDDLELLRVKSSVDYREWTGPFDLVGDVHGCMPELEKLLAKMGYVVSGSFEAGYKVESPEGRTLVFVGDLTDRGPDSPGVLRLVMDLVKSGQALCVPGNHDDKLMRHLKGNKVKLKHGLEVTVEQMENLPTSFHHEVRDFIQSLPMHLLLDGGELVVAHAGLKANMHGRTAGGVRSFCLYGETTGEIDEFGLPVRYNWAGEYTGNAKVIYGHTPVPSAEWINQTMDIDTGCVFGGKLTALRYPELTLVEVPAEKEYAKAKRPMGLNTPLPETIDPRDNLMPFNRFSGRNLVLTRLKYNITLTDELAKVTTDHLVARGVDPRWLVYLPALVSVGKSSSQGSFLEHPREAFSYFEKKGVDELLVQSQPHGKEVILVLCKSFRVAHERFGVDTGQLGQIYDATGQAALTDKEAEQSLLHQLARGLKEIDFWEEQSTEWLVLEGILQIPDAQSISDNLQEDVLASGTAYVNRIEALLKQAQANGLGSDQLTAELPGMMAGVSAFGSAHACQKDALPNSPLFHLRWVVASEGKVHLGQSPELNLPWAQKWAEKTPALELCPMKRINLHNPEETRDAIEWWLNTWQSGHSGIFTFPPERILERGNDISQPVLKVRHPEALRLLFGPRYQESGQLEQLRIRSLKEIRQQAVREFALGYEAISRFVEKQGLIEVHECINNQLSLKSRLRDPRL